MAAEMAVESTVQTEGASAVTVREDPMERGQNALEEHSEKIPRAEVSAEIVLEDRSERTLREGASEEIALEEHSERTQNALEDHSERTLREETLRAGALEASALGDHSETTPREETQRAEASEVSVLGGHSEKIQREGASAEESRPATAGAASTALRRASTGRTSTTSAMRVKAESAE